MRGFIKIVIRLEYSKSSQPNYTSSIRFLLLSCPEYPSVNSCITAILEFVNQPLSKSSEISIDITTDSPVDNDRSNEN